MPSFPRRRAARARRIPRGAFFVAGLIGVLLVTGCQDESRLASSPASPRPATTDQSLRAAGARIPRQYIILSRGSVRDTPV